MIREKYEQAKQNIREHRNAYLIGVGGVFLGAVAMGNRAQIVDGFKFLHLQYKSPNVYNVALARRGHPGFIVKCCETGELFASQNRAAAAHGISSPALSQHLNGLKEHAGGSHFERVGQAL